MFIFIFFLVFGQSGDGLAHLFGFYWFLFLYVSRYRDHLFYLSCLPLLLKVKENPKFVLSADKQ